MQTGLPMTAAAAAAAQSKLKHDQRMVFVRELLPWAARAGAQCQDLMSIFYETHVDEDLEELRQRWHVITAPAFIDARTAIAKSSPT